MRLTPWRLCSSATSCINAATKTLAKESTTSLLSTLVHGSSRLERYVFYFTVKPSGSTFTPCKYEISLGYLPKCYVC